MPKSGNFSPAFSGSLSPAATLKGGKSPFATQNQEVFMLLFEYYADGLSQGKVEGKVEDARKLLADGKYTAEEISKLLQIPTEAFA